MNCNHFRTAIRHQGYRLNAACRDHLHACEPCRAWYQDELLQVALASQPLPEPAADFVDRVLARATTTPGRRAGGLPAPAWAVAAALVVALVGVLAVAPGFRHQPLPTDLAEALTEPRMVRVVIHSAGPRDDATVTIRLAEDLELDGYPGLHLLEWQTDLADGRNLLALPVRTKNTGGAIWVAVSYGGMKKQEMRIEVDAG